VDVYKDQREKVPRVYIIYNNKRGKKYNNHKKKKKKSATDDHIIYKGVRVARRTCLASLGVGGERKICNNNNNNNNSITVWRRWWRRTLRADGRTDGRSDRRGPPGVGMLKVKNAPFTHKDRI